MICSIYKLTFEPTSGAPIILTELEDDLLSEPAFTGSQEMEVVQLLRATHAQSYPRGNVSRVCEFTRLYELPTANDARQFELDHASLLDTISKGRLKIEIKDQDPRWIENATLTATPEAKDLGTMRSTQIAFHYTITGGAIVTA